MQVLYARRFVPQGQLWSTILLGVLGLIAGVAFGVNLATGADQLPDGLEGTTPWFGGAALVLLAGAVVEGVRRSVPVRVRETAAGLALEVGGPRPLTIAAPLTVTATWFPVPQTRRLETKKLMLHVGGAGGAVVLADELGAIYAAPEGWPEGRRLPPSSMLYNSLYRAELPRLERLLRGAQPPS